jgi:hypothetical protein
MKKVHFIFLVLVVITLQSVQGQLLRDTISVSRNSFIYRGNVLSANQLLEKMQNNPDAYSEMSVAKLNYDVSMVFSYVGGFCIGFPIGQSLGGGKPVWGLLGVGAAALVVAIPFSFAYINHARKAVRIYNSSLTRFGMERININLQISGNGIGLCYRF